MPREKPLALSQDDLLAIVREEQAQSVGFDNDDDLTSSREAALDYFKGEDLGIPALPNRSEANDTALSEAVDTVMPDLMEIFTGGDDVATFRPQGEEDEDAAAQETAYVNHVLFNENDGWRVLYAHLFDGLLMKLGVTKVWGEEGDDVSEEQFTGQTAEAIAVLEGRNAGEIVDLVAVEPDPLTGEALFDFTLRTVKPSGRCRVMEVPPEDFAFARDTVRIAEATYCAMRSRPRAQDLIADGYDPDRVADLTPYGTTEDAVAQARDQAGEHDDGARSTNLYNLHQVEIVEHYIRVDADDDGQPELWRIVTSADATVLLDMGRASRVPFAVSTPFLVAHRLIGMSLYDKLREVQRIKTVLLRALLDSGYFALNQRYEVAEGPGRANANTLADLLNNVPGAPVRSQDGQSVRPLGGGQLGFDVAGALEYMSTVAEQRSGVVRNAQGLNPDTLHDTAKGMQALMGAAQKRVRMMARVFAETGIRDLYLLIHDVCRTTVKGSQKKRLLGGWVEVDPSQWGARNDMSIEVGIGSGGREMELAALKLVGETQAELRQINPAMVSDQNLYNTAKRLAERAGLKGAELYFTDPATAEPTPPQPDPELIKVEQEGQIKREQMQLEAELKREQMMGEFQLERERMAMEAQTKVITGAVGTLGRQTQLGGEPG